ncbi:tetratricopeptide repeat protein [Nocardia sp. NRRL S-836]|uniref:tetratricopeptide repeat protein n=1 Tax=Nocardia sp. NRRL S-836 TaxID=1519492 RepID=UPI0006B0415B|nr:tetratricopeptide repeat protein [Nocardia sp. NRRL S-836]
MADGQLAEPVRQALTRLALHTALRQGIERVSQARGGGLYILGWDSAVESVCGGGFVHTDVPVSSDNINQLSKMDLAVVVSADDTTILRSNATLTPSAFLATQGSGARHLAAASTAREITYPVVAVSEENGAATLYVGAESFALNSYVVLMSKVSIAVLDLHTCVGKLGSEGLGRRETAVLTERARLAALRLEVLLLELGEEDAGANVLLSDYSRQLGMDRVPADPRHLPSGVALMHVVARELDEWHEQVLNVAQQALSSRPVPVDCTSNRVFPTMSFDENTALRWIDQERTMLVASIKEAVDQGAPATALRRSMAMLEFFYRSKSRTEWIEVTSLAVIAARQAGDHEAEAALLTSSAVVQRELGNFDIALELFAAARLILGELENRVGEAELLNHLAFALEEVGEADRAVQTCADAITLVQELDEPRVHGKILNNLAGICCRAGRHEEAVAHVDKALDLFVKDEYDRGRAWALSVKGNIHHRAGQHGEAESCYRAAVSERSAQGDEYGVAVSRAELGDVLAALGDDASACDEWAAAADYFSGRDDARATEIHKKLAELEQR